MRRLLFLLLLLLAVSAGCAAGEPRGPGDVSRLAVLSDEFVDDVAGEPMKLAYDSRDETYGMLRWAWEETGRQPRLLVVQVFFPPSAVDRMYDEAEAGEGCVPLAVPKDAEACQDARAGHVRYGAYYIKITVLGFSDEEGAMELIAQRLVEKLPHAR